jgi:hypothetical protein
MNSQQKTFIKTLDKSILQAEKAKSKILTALNIGGVGDVTTAKTYVVELQRFINAAQRMKTECCIAFGKNSNQIAIDALASDNEN